MKKSDTKVNVLIVGGGFAGLSAAIEIRLAGVEDVRVVYDNADVSAASKSAHGLSAIKGILEGDAELFAMKLEGHEGFLNWLKGIETIVGVRRPAHVWRTGVNETFLSKESFDREFGRIYRRDFVGAKNVKLNFGECGYFAKAFYPSDFWIDPEYLLNVLMSAVKTLGVSVTQGRVQDIRPRSNGASVRFHDDSELWANHTVIAAGAGCSKILQKIVTTTKIDLKGVPGLTFKAKCQIPDLAEVKGTTSIVGIENQAFWGSTSGTSVELNDYVQLENDLNERESIEAGAAIIKKNWPDISIDKKITFKWGVRVKGRGRAPVVCCVDSSANIWLNTGYYKSGIILSWLCAKRLAARISSRLKIAEHQEISSR